MNIVSVSVFGDGSRYIVGAYAQYALAKHYYPGWEFRLYTDDASRFCLPGANVIEVKDGSYGMFWRFRPMFEADDNVVIVRDADSRIGYREACAVYEWMASGKRFHSIKDHPNHVMPIMGGVCGMRGRFDESLHKQMLACSHAKKHYGADENFLKEYVYPVIEGDVLEHTMYSGWFGMSRNFIKNRYEFVGNGFDENDFPLYPPTVEERKGYDRLKLDDSCRFKGYL